MIKSPKLFIGPMSKLVVDSVIEYAEEHQIPLGLIPSRRQVDFSGGYVNQWTTAGFSSYVRSRTNLVYLVRDHGGPSQGEKPDAGYDSFYDDCFNLDILHIDPWKVYDLEDAAEKTKDYINFCYQRNPSLWFEIGTEQAIHEYTAEELENLIYYLKCSLGANEYSRIKYAVIQSGTSIKNGHNTGDYSAARLADMIQVCKKYHLLSKEHNGDYLDSSLIQEKFKLNLDAINIAPEFGQIETCVFLNCILTEGRQDLFDLFYQLCLESGKWKKWLTNSDDAGAVIKATGHYVFSHPKFETIRSFFDVQEKIKKEIKKRIADIVGVL